MFGKKKYSGFLLNISQSGALIQLDHKMKKIPEEAGAPLEIRLVEEKESIKGTLIRAFLDKDQKFFCAATFSDLLPEI